MPLKNNENEQHLKDGSRIVFLGEAGFPVGLGAIQRMTLMGQALLWANSQVSVLCRKGILHPPASDMVAVEGEFKGIHYLYTSQSVQRPSSF